MNDKKTIDEILQGYPQVNNLSELLDSDVLVLPINKEEDMFDGWQELISEQNKDIRIKYYTTNKTRTCVGCQTEFYINVGILVISTIELLTKVIEWIREKHNEDPIDISIHVHTGDNYYVSNTFKGNGNNVVNEMEIFKNKLK